MAKQSLLDDYTRQPTGVQQPLQSTKHPIPIGILIYHQVI